MPSLFLPNPEIAGPVQDVGLGIEMAEWVKREFERSAIKKAGRLLADRLPYTPEAIEAFRIAHNWRMAHAYPMMRERAMLTRACAGLGDTAGRIKRMDSIRKKLRRSSISLEKIQDLAGVRAILPDMNAVNAVVLKYQGGWGASSLHKMDDYILRPKSGGYRSIHLIRSFSGAGHGVHYERQRVEIQIRTRLQHIWATAVEAVGAVRGEDLKAGEGDSRWLRLLELMSARFSEIEGQPLSDYVSQSPVERSIELRTLAADLDAVATLSTFRTVVKASENSSYRHFIIRLDASAGEVEIIAKPTFSEQSDRYLEANNEAEGGPAVLVSVDSIEALRRAYPNYFLDVGEFVQHLREALEYESSEPIHSPVSKRPSYIERINTSFLTNWRRR